MVRNRSNKNDFTRYDRHGCFFSLKHWIAANEPVILYFQNHQ